MKLEVGQRLWFVMGNYANERGHEVVVTHIGRKWADLEDGNRVEIDTLRVDSRQWGYMGQCECGAHIDKLEGPGMFGSAAPLISYSVVCNKHCYTLGGASSREDAIKAWDDLGERKG